MKPAPRTYKSDGSPRGIPTAVRECERQALKLRNAGVSRAKLAELFGVAERTIDKWLSRARDQS